MKIGYKGTTKSKRDDVGTPADSLNELVNELKEKTKCSNNKNGIIDLFLQMILGEKIDFYTFLITLGNCDNEELLIFIKAWRKCIKVLCTSQWKLLLNSAIVDLLIDRVHSFFTNHPLDTLELLSCFCDILELEDIVRSDVGSFMFINFPFNVLSTISSDYYVQIKFDQEEMIAACIKMIGLFFISNDFILDSDKIEQSFLLFCDGIKKNSPDFIVVLSLVGLNNFVLMFKLIAIKRLCSGNNYLNDLFNCLDSKNEIIQSKAIDVISNIIKFTDDRFKLSFLQSEKFENLDLLSKSLSFQKKIIKLMTDMISIKGMLVDNIIRTKPFNQVINLLDNSPYEVKYYCLKLFCNFFNTHQSALFINTHQEIIFIIVNFLNDINFDDILYFCQSFHNFLYYVKLFDFNELKSIILSTDIIEVLNKTFEHEHENNDSYISLVINDLIV